MDTEKIVLQPMSIQVLSFLSGKEPMRAADVAMELGLKTRAVDACITKSLIRWGLAERKYILSKVLKKEHSEVVILKRGEEWLEFYRKKQENK
jgi:predicted DNA-binding transcriptional regulator